MVDTAADLLQIIAEKRKLTDEQRRAAAELILLNPDLLVAQYKNSGGLSSEAERFLSEGNMLVAENRLASAAKLALYEGALDTAKKYLDKCVTVSQTDNSTYKLALGNFEIVSDSVIEYYKTKSGASGAS